MEERVGKYLLEPREAYRRPFRFRVVIAHNAYEVRTPCKSVVVVDADQFLPEVTRGVTRGVRGLGDNSDAYLKAGSVKYLCRACDKCRVLVAMIGSHLLKVKLPSVVAIIFSLGNHGAQGDRLYGRVVKQVFVRGRAKLFVRDKLHYLYLILFRMRDKFGLKSPRQGAVSAQLIHLWGENIDIPRIFHKRFFRCLVVGVVKESGVGRLGG